ncbi:MAG: site-2 protease family protein [Deltaproteobacteria bacterium]|nr:site-2 protease family protein [Deltaproteobacteria bacterium]
MKISRQIPYLLLWLTIPIGFGIIYPYIDHNPRYLGWLTAGLIIYVLFFSVVVHELFHGLAARFCGDYTAEDSGRLTFNPISHVSVVGTIFVPLALHLLHASMIFGWAKPVPFNPINLRHHPRDQVLLALSGPFSNFALSYIFFCLYIIIGTAYNHFFPESIIRLHLDIMSPIPIGDVPFGPLWFIIFQILSIGILINIVLGVFNLIPFPPLDGSWILKAVLPKKATVFFGKIQILGFILIILAVQFHLLDLFFFPAGIAIGLLHYVSVFFLG